MILWLRLLLPQYRYVYANNYSFDFDRQVKMLRTSVPNDGLPVLGNGNDWFSFFNRPFYYYNYLGDYNKIGLTEFYLVEDEDYRENYGSMRQWITSQFSETAVTTLTINGRIFKKKMKFEIK